MREKKIKRYAYRGRRLSRPAIIILAIAAYILIIAAGIAFITIVPFFGRKERMMNLAKERGEYTISHFSEYTSQTFGTEYYLFNEYSALVTSDQPYLAANGTADLRSMVPRLLAQGSSYDIKYLTVKGSSPRLVTLAGQCVYASSGRRFVSFIVRDLNDLGTTIIIFSGLFTLLYAVGAILIVYIERQHRLLRTLQQDLISNVSHELKTPITSIKAMAELVYDGMYSSEEDLKRYSHTVLQEADRLNDLVFEIINLAKLQSHKAEFKKEICHADGVFTPIIDHYMMICSDLGINMDTSELALSSIPTLFTDPVQIQRVFPVLLDNAIKFAGKGGHIWVRSKACSDCVTFSVEDDGPGISPENIKRVFERFYKADVTHNSQGSGLGLAIAHEIVLGLNERIWVESIEGKGSTFYFTVSYR